MDRAQRKLEALEQAGVAPDAPELEKLRGDIARAKTRLDGFRRRRAKLGEPDTTVPAG
jgi:hypothetical protein